MKKFLLLLTLPFLMLGCNNEDLPQPILQADITVMAYLVAENNLDDELKENIRTMFLGLSSFDKSANLLIYWDGNSSIGGIDNPMILRYVCDGKGNINGKSTIGKDFTLKDILDLADPVKQYSSQVSTDKVVMSQVLNDMINLCTTDKVGLVAGSHASSWVAPYSRGRAFGDDNGNSIKLSDMAEAIGSTNRIFDFLLFDACLMGSAEVCYDFKDVTNFQIVSALEIPADGFPYNLMIADLYEGTPNGYQKACEKYISYYGDRADKNIINSWGTISLINSSKMESFSKVIKEELLSHKDELKNFKVSGLQEYGRNWGKYVSVDIEHFIKTLNQGNIPTNFENALNEVVVYTDCLDKTSDNANSYIVDKNNYSGLGLYVPIKGKYEWNNHFKTIAWYNAVGWNEITFDWHF